MMRSSARLPMNQMPQPRNIERNQTSAAHIAKNWKTSTIDRQLANSDSGNESHDHRQCELECGNEDEDVGEEEAVTIRSSTSTHQRGARPDERYGYRHDEEREGVALRQRKRIEEDLTRPGESPWRRGALTRVHLASTPARRRRAPRRSVRALRPSRPSAIPRNGLRSASCCTVGAAYAEPAQGSSVQA